MPKNFNDRRRMANDRLKTASAKSVLTLLKLVETGAKQLTV
jgi:hypothetical protein